MSFQKTALGRLLCAAVALAAPLPALAEIPAGYPADYADIVAKAEVQIRVRVYRHFKALLPMGFCRGVAARPL